MLVKLRDDIFGFLLEIITADIIYPHYWLIAFLYLIPLCICTIGVFIGKIIQKGETK